MGAYTSIEWADSSLNATSGCDGCELWIRGKTERCYAGKIHERFSPSKAYPGPFEQIDLHPGRMAKAAKWPDLRGTKRPDKPWLDGLPRVIFVGDMSDLFSKDVPFDYIRDEVIENIRSKDGSRHLWMILTKQPKRLAKFARWLADQGIAWPTNIMSGTSITSNAVKARILDLMGVPGKLFLSVEPLIEEISLVDIPWNGWRWNVLNGDASYFGVSNGPDNCANHVSLVIVGGESGKEARPFDVAWARKLRDECQRYGPSYFCKQIGSHPIEGGKRIPGRHVKGGDWNEWPADLRVRQFPQVF